MHCNTKAVLSKLLLVGVLMLLCTLSIFGGPAKSTSAATSCYSGAISFSAPVGFSGLSHAPSSGSYTTTSRCHDINLRFTNLPEGVYVDVCWSRYGWCRSINYGFTYVGPGDTSWHTIATDVKDGTTFTVQFIPYDYGHTFTASGYVAF